MSESVNPKVLNSKRLILKRIEKCTIVRSKKYGTLRLRFLSLHDWEVLLEILPEPITDRDFVIRVLNHQLVKREEDPIQIADLPDRLILHIASRWAQNELSERGTQLVRVKNFSDFRELVRTYLDKQNAKIRDSLEQLSNISTKVSQLFVGSLGSTVFQDKILQSRQSLLEFARIPYEMTSQYNVLIQQAITGLVQTEKVLAGIQFDFSKIIQATDIRKGIDQMMSALIPTMSGFRDLNSITIAQISAAFNNLPKSNLTVISQASFETSRSISEAFSLLDIDYPTLIASAATQKGFEPVQNTKGLLLPLLPDAAEVQAYRSGNYDVYQLAEEQQADHVIAFDSTLDVYLLSLIKKVDLYDKNRIDPDAWHKTCSRQFNKNISNAFQLSPTIQTRTRHLEDALSAHQQSIFNLSIPAFLTLLEGVLTDLLVVKNIFVRKGSKVIDPSSGKESTGLFAKINTYERIYPGHPTVAKLTQFMKAWVNPTRNTIMHGVQTNDYTQEVSTWLVLLIYYLAWQLGTFEREMILK